MNPTWFIVAVTYAILCLGVGFKVGTETGYKWAYIDTHEKTIEEKAKEKFPSLWIKYNVEHTSDEK